MNFRCSFPVLALILVAGTAHAQMAHPPFSGHGPAPLLYARFDGPQGLRTTFYQGSPNGREFDSPTVVGLRPGYIYRVKLSNLPRLPAVSLYPTLEVRGSLNLPHGVGAPAYPAPVVFTEDDIDRALSGSLITKVIYLEDPERAAPAGTKPGQVLQIDLPPNRDPLAESRDLGRPMLIVRLGEREATPDELAHQNVAGTILLPGEKALAFPRQPPVLPWACWQYFDPKLGPRKPEDECLHDGGDRGNNAGIGADGKLHGLDPEDTVAEYTDSRGQRSVVCSNRICLCVPRFAVLRIEQPLARMEASLGPDDARCVRGQAQVQRTQPSLQTQQYEQLKGIQGRKRPSGTSGIEGVASVLNVKVLYAEHIDIGPFALLCTKAPQQLTETERTRMKQQVESVKRLAGVSGLSGTEQVEGTSVAGRVEGGVAVVTATVETHDFSCICGEKPMLAPDKPLALCKWADKHDAQVGDVVTIFLRYSNHGGRPITDVAVSDSLNGRLEYIPGSAQSDRDAVFTTQQNEAGSLILRWELGGRLLPGQSGVVRFQVKVR
jgi:uncharacterized repeat protein (TIGR01451 family)